MPSISLCVSFLFSFSFFFSYISRANRYSYQVGKKVPECVRKGNWLQDCLPVKFQDVKFKDPRFKHEIFVRIDMKHSYFSNYFITC